MSNTRKVYAGAAVVTTITAGVTSTATAITLDDSTGWPSGGDFYVVIDPDTASEEKFLANGRTGDTITLATSSDRGIDGTSAETHNAGAKIYPTVTAVDLDEANNAVVNTVGRITQKGGMLAGTSNATLAQLAPGTNGQMLHVDTSTTTGLAFGALPDGAVSSSSAKFAAGVVDATALASSAVTTVKINAAAVTEPKLADDAVNTRVLGPDAVTGAELADDAVGNEHLEAQSVGTDELQDEAVTPAKQDPTLPRGYIDRASVATMQTCGTGTTSISGLSVTFTGVANRRYKITGSVRVAVGSVATSVLVTVVGNATTLCRIFDSFAETGPDVQRCFGDIDWVPGVGSHTVRIDAGFSANANNLVGGSGATDTGFIRVEDIGGT